MTAFPVATRTELDRRLVAAQRAYAQRGEDQKINQLLLLWEKITIYCGGAPRPDGLYFFPEDLRAMATEAARAAHVGAAKHALDPNGAYDNDRLRTLFHIHHHLEAAAGSLESVNTALRDQGTRDRARKMDMAA